MASARVGLPIMSCHWSTGTWLVTSVELASKRSSRISRRSRACSGVNASGPQSSQGLRERRLRVGVVRGAEHADEYLRLAQFPGRRIGDRDLLAGIIHEQLVAGGVMLAHDRRQPPLELAEQVTKTAVAVAIRMGVAIFLPQNQKIDAGTLHLPRQRRPLRLDAPPPPRQDALLAEQPLFENAVRDLGRQRPAKTGLLRPLEIVLNGASRSPERPPDLSCAYALVMQTKHLP